MLDTAPPQPPADLERQVRAALEEDVGAGDVTASLIPAAREASAELVCREEAVLAGRPWTRSATIRPKAGPMPNPCPLMPVARVSPGSAATTSTTGTASGITSIIPAQLCTAPTPPSAGKVALKSRRIRSA